MIKELREKMDAIAKEIRRMANLSTPENPRDFTAEEQEAWEKANKEYNSLKQQVAIAERAEEVEKEMRAVVSDEGVGREDITPETRSRQNTSEIRTLEQRAEDSAYALQAFCLRATGHEVTERHVQAEQRIQFRRDGRELIIPLSNTGEFQRIRREARALGDAPMTVTTTAGGYLIDTGFVPQLEKSMLAFANVQAVCETIRTPSGNDLHWPTSNDTSNAGAMIAINTQDTDAKPTIGEVVFKAFKGTSKPILVPTELMQDSVFNMTAYLSEAIGERLGRLKAAQLTTGVGTTAPNGIVTATSAGKTCASATAITDDEILDLIHHIDPAYRSEAFNCGFMFHDNVYLALRKLRDGEGRLLLDEELRTGRLHGWPVTINQSMASAVQASAKVMLFGAMRKYVCREVAELRFYHMVERFRDYDQDGFVAYIRFDGNLLDAGTNPIEHMIMHS